MIATIKKWGDRGFWPLVLCYGLYLIYAFFSYYEALKYIPGKAFLEGLFLRKLTIVAFIVLTAAALKLSGKTRLATFILGVPAAVVLGTLLIALAVVAFLAILFIFFGEK